jgi:C1A family cysteine protease
VSGVVLSGLLAAGIAFGIQRNKTSNVPAPVVAKFNEWAKKHGRSYGQAERSVRLTNFYAAFLKVEESNKKNSWKSGLNQFADMTVEEFKIKFTGLRPEAKKVRQVSATPVEKRKAPSSVDWRAKGAVTPIKNQGQCGSCWAFSTTGSLEGLNFIKHGALLSFSEQQLVDCSGSYGNNGCNGGLMDSGFRYVKDHGVELESRYPYTARDGACNYVKSDIRFQNTGFTDVPRDNEAALATAVAQQPVSVAVDAPPFMYYTGGIFNDRNCGNSLDHGVLAVGYGSESGQDYWIVKNSWGASWGEKGYIRMARNVQAAYGMCGIAQMASYPTL